MEKLNHPAILVVDMLNDFVTGSLACDRGKAIVPATARLLKAAREKGVPVIFCNDAHLPGIDRELQIWGDHAIAAFEKLGDYLNNIMNILEAAQKEIGK